MDLSVVIVSFNVCEHLAKCLRSIFGKSHRHSIEVFVVDNASLDGSVPMVRSQYPQVKVIANSENRGFAAANNQAIAMSRGRYVLLLNPDTEVVGMALDDMISFMDARQPAERVGMLGVKILHTSGSVQVSCCPFPTVGSTLSRLFYLAKIFPHIKTFAPHRFAVPDWESPGWTDWVTGACLMVRREVIDQAGLLDEGYFLYYEEMDWCLRAKRAGWKVLYWPSATVVHHGCQSVAQSQALSFEHSIAGLLRFYSKHHRGPDVLVVHLVVLFVLLVRATRLPAAIPRLSGRPWPARPSLGRQFLVVLRSLRNYFLALL